MVKNNKQYKPKMVKNCNKSQYTPESVNTATYLIIVESPSKCKKIEEYLGSQYCCISSKGHIRTIKNGLKSIDEKNNFQITFDIIEEKREHVIWMREIIDKFDKSNIIIATDDDREGEAIAWHICKIFDIDIQTTKRAIFHEITQKAIIKAIQNTITININIVNAQLCRQVLDVLVGYKISPVLWKHVYRNKENSLSAGRCQTPALRLVHDNEIESQTVSPSYTYKITGSFFPKKVVFDLSKEFETETQVLHFLELSKDFSHDLSIGSQNKTIKIPPKPFNTSTLLQKASSTFNISPKETMSICQQLYQDGFITYMRTESQKYSDVFLDIAAKYIKSRFDSDEYIGNMDDIINKDSSNPHEAIRATNIDVACLQTESSRQNTIYKLIWRNTVESCMAAARFNNTSVSITAPLESTYKHNVEVPIFLGFMKIAEETKVNTTQDQNKGSALLLYLKSSPNKKIKYNTISSSISIHGKHSHYTEASLIKKLEDLGIGRPSTYAMIIDTIIERGYVKKTDIEGTTVKSNEYSLTSDNHIINKKETERTFGKESGKLVIQPIGTVVSDFLYDHFTSLFSYDYTKKMECQLDEISSGQHILNPWNICETCNDEIAGLLTPLQKMGKQTFDIVDTSEYKFIFEKYGPVLRKVLEDGSYEYKTVKKDIKIDLDKLKNGKYSMDELINENIEKQIGEYNGFPLLLKSGPYGFYIEYGNKKESLESFGITNYENVNIIDILKARDENSQKNDSKIIRVLTNELSIRNGKYGAYIHYKTDDQSKPQFFNIQKFKESYRHCSDEVLLKWIKEKYNV